MDKLFKFSLFLFLLFAFNAFAKEDPTVTFDDIKNGLSQYACELSIYGNTVTFTIDEQRVLSKIGILRKDGFLNGSASDFILYSKPKTFAGTIGFLFNSLFTAIYYDSNKKADKLHYSVLLKNFDDYGNESLHEVYSLDFNREIYKKINWENFDWTKLPKVAKNLKFSGWYHAELINEMANNDE